MTRIIIVVALSLACTSAWAEGRIRLIYDNAAAHEQASAALMKSSGDVKSIKDYIEQTYQLPENITIRFGAEEGPLFDPQRMEIWMPYGFADEIRQRFKADNYSETGVKLDDAVQDVIAHTVLHELGHAMIALYDLPVLGKEEDSVDDLAVILLNEIFEDGQEMSITAADMFDLESGDESSNDEASYWDDHSLDVQRYYRTLCLVYGSDSKKYAHMLKDYESIADRSGECIETYDLQHESWKRLLEEFER